MITVLFKNSLYNKLAFHKQHVEIQKDDVLLNCSTNNLVGSVVDTEYNSVSINNQGYFTDLAVA